MASYAEYLVYGVRIKVANSKAPHVWNFDGGLKISADFACANLRDVSSIPEGVNLCKYRMLAYMFASMYHKATRIPNVSKQDPEIGFGAIFLWPDQRRNASTATIVSNILAL